MFKNSEIYINSLSDRNINYRIGYKAKQMESVGELKA